MAVRKLTKAQLDKLFAEGRRLRVKVRKEWERGRWIPVEDLLRKWGYSDARV